MEKQGSFSIWQDGMKVAGGFGPLEDIKREAAHYKLMYSQDGPVKVIVRESKPKKKKSNERPISDIDILERIEIENSVQLACAKAFGNDLSDILSDAAAEIKRLRSRLLKTFQHDNNCIQTGVPCRVEKCSCYLEMKDWHSDG